MKTLLAIINEPKDSKAYIKYLANLAIDLNATVHLLHVQNPNRFTHGITGTTGLAAAQVQLNLEQFAQAARETMAKHVNDVKQTLEGDVYIDYSSVLGLTDRIANDLIAENKVDIVVLEGQKGESFWTQTPSNIEIIENVNCPVIIVPHHWIYTPLTEIVYASNYKEEDIKGIKKMVALTEQFSPTINVLHITDSIDFEEKVKKAGFLDMLQDQVAYKQLTVKAISDNQKSDTAELLNSYSQLVHANLIVLTKENKSFFDSIFRSDKTKKLIKSANLPVLVYHEKK